MRRVIYISKKKSPEDSQEELTKTDRKSSGSKVADLISTIITWVLSAAIIIGAVLFAFNSSPTKSIFGFRYYTVLTPSMSPTYDVGDMIFVQLASAENINEGDVITFNPSLDSDAYLTHRVIQKIDDYEGTGETCFRTKGDANDSDDSFLIESERVIGIVRFGIPKVGYIIRFFQLRWYFIVPIAIMLFILGHLLKLYFDDDEDAEGESENMTPAADSV